MQLLLASVAQCQDLGIYSNKTLELFSLVVSEVLIFQCLYELKEKGSEKLGLHGCANTHTHTNAHASLRSKLGCAEPALGWCCSVSFWIRLLNFLGDFSLKADATVWSLAKQIYIFDKSILHFFITWIYLLIKLLTFNYLFSMIYARSSRNYYTLQTY